MSAINWNDGQLITLGEGDTASCTGGLNPGQLYCLFFYNAAGNDASTTVQVVWSNSQPPVPVTVPGTTQKEGLAALCFVDGNQTNSVSASVGHNQPGAQLEAFICSVKMPVNTAGINNKQLPLDGQPQSFKSFTRFYAVPASHWYSGQIQSNVNEFISVQFTQHQATVNIVNSTMNPANVIAYAGDSEPLVTVNQVDKQTLTWNLQGNGQQIVWMNADSIQDSESATITVQSLASAYDVFA